MENIQKKNNFQDFLSETYFCDINHPEIQKVARLYKSKFNNDKEIAINLFLFVRDKIKYRVGVWGRKSSEVLNQGYGMCTSSTNLLVALLRAANIPAGYCIYKVVGGHSFGHILPVMIKNRMSHKNSVHIVAYVYLNNKWIKCDSSTDRELSDSTKHISKMTDLIEWDGELDAVHLIASEHIVEISYPLSNIDFQMRKKPRYIVKQHVFHIGNHYLYFLRNFASKYKSNSDLQQSFKKWLRRYHYVRYYRYKFIYYIYETIYIAKGKIYNINKISKKWFIKKIF